MIDSQYKLIVSDMDGTLLNEFSQLADETVETIIYLQQQGIRFAICTGRPIFSCAKFIEKLKLEKYNGFFIGQNGQYIKSFETGEIIEKEKLKQDDYHKICTLAQSYGVLTEFFYETHAYILFPNKHKFVSALFCGAYSFKSLISQSKRYKMKYLTKLIDMPDLPKLCFLGKPNTLKKFAQALLDLQEYDTFLVNAAWLEVVKIGISKGSALYDLERLTGISINDMIAFGDGENDLSMLEIAGLSCAMKNAMPNPKKVAKCVIDSNINNGVANKLKEIYKL